MNNSPLVPQVLDINVLKKKKKKELQQQRKSKV